jgi:hypothetical protein
MIINIHGEETWAAIAVLNDKGSSTTEKVVDATTGDAVAVKATYTTIIPIPISTADGIGTLTKPVQVIIVKTTEGQRSKVARAPVMTKWMRIIAEAGKDVTDTDEVARSMMATAVVEKGTTRDKYMGCPDGTPTVTQAYAAACVREAAKYAPIQQKAPKTEQAWQETNGTQPHMDGATEVVMYEMVQMIRDTSTAATATEAAEDEMEMDRQPVRIPDEVAEMGETGKVHAAVRTIAALTDNGAKLEARTPASVIATAMTVPVTDETKMIERLTKSAELIRSTQETAGRSGAAMMQTLMGKDMTTRTQHEGDTIKQTIKGVTTAVMMITYGNNTDKTGQTELLGGATAGNGNTYVVVAVTAKHMGNEDGKEVTAIRRKKDEWITTSRGDGTEGVKGRRTPFDEYGTGLTEMGKIVGGDENYSVETILLAKTTATTERVGGGNTDETPQPGDGRWAAAATTQNIVEAARLQNSDHQQLSKAIRHELQRMQQSHVKCMREDAKRAEEFMKGNGGSQEDVAWTIAGAAACALNMQVVVTGVDGEGSTNPAAEMGLQEEKGTRPTIHFGIPEYPDDNSPILQKQETETKMSSTVISKVTVQRVHKYHQLAVETTHRRRFEHTNANLMTSQKEEAAHVALDRRGNVRLKVRGDAVATVKQTTGESRGSKLTLTRGGGTTTEAEVEISNERWIVKLHHTMTPTTRQVKPKQRTTPRDKDERHARPGEKGANTQRHTDAQRTRADAQQRAHNTGRQSPNAARHGWARPKELEAALKQGGKVCARPECDQTRTQGKSTRDHAGALCSGCTNICRKDAVGYSYTGISGCVNAKCTGMHLGPKGYLSPRGRSEQWKNEETRTTKRRNNTRQGSQRGTTKGEDNMQHNREERREGGWNKRARTQDQPSRDGEGGRATDTKQATAETGAAEEQAMVTEDEDGESIRRERARRNGEEGGKPDPDSDQD